MPSRQFRKIGDDGDITYGRFMPSRQFRKTLGINKK